MRCAPNFQRRLEPFPTEAWDRSPTTVIGLFADFTIGYVSDAWGRVATHRGEPADMAAIGRNYLDPIPGDWRGFYDRLLTRVKATRVAASHDYRCTAKQRPPWFRLDARPLDDGLQLVHRAIDLTDDQRVLDERYRNEHGVVIQCAHCGFTEDPDDGGWRWVPHLWSEASLATSHGVCEACLVHHYYSASTPW